MRVFPNVTVDTEFQTLDRLDYTGSLNDKQYSYLSDRGHTGALPDMFKYYREDSANLWLDFKNELYLKDLNLSGFSDVVTHTRASTATMVDSDGVLKWGPHNLLQRSEEFNVSPWFTTFASVSANTSTAPDGASTADTIVEDGATNIHRIGEPIPSFSGVTTFRVFAKAGAGSRFFTIGVNKNGTDWASATFDLSAGTNTQTLVGGTYSGVSASISAAANGFYLCSITATIDGFDSVLVGLASSGTHLNSSRGFDSYTGDGTSSVIVWGAHLYRSDLGGMVDNPDRGDSYVPTTSSAVYLPRRGHHVWNGSAWVNEGVLHESEARTNVLTNSTLAGATVGVFGTGGVFPTGVSVLVNSALTSEIISFGTINGFPYFDLKVSGSPSGTNYQLALNDSGSAASSGQTWTASAFVQMVGGSVTNISSSDLRIVEESSGSFLTASQTAFPLGAKAFVYVTRTLNDASTTNVRQRLRLNLTAGNAIDVTLRIFAPQLEQGPTPSSFIPTAGSTVTRSADVMTIPAANLPYPAPEYIGPELVTNGTFDTDISGWTDNSDVGGSIAWNAAGYLDIINTTGTARAYQNATVEIGKVYLLSFDTIASPTNADFLYIGSSTGGGDIVSGQPIVAGRNEIAFVATSTTASVGFRNFGTGSTVSLDNISVREINPLAVSIQMDGRVTYADEDESIAAYFVRWELNSDNRIIELLRTSAGTGNYSTFQEANNVVDRVDTDGSFFSPDILIPFNIAGRHGSTFINGAINGTALTADTTPVALPDLSATNLTLGSNYNGTIRTFRIWSKDIGDAGLVEATA